MLTWIKITPLRFLTWWLFFSFLREVFLEASIGLQSHCAADTLRKEAREALLLGSFGAKPSSASPSLVSTGANGLDVKPKKAG